MNTQSNIARALKELGWRGAADEIDAMLSGTKARSAGLQKLLEALVDIERNDRAERSMERRRRRARIGPFTPWCDMDLDWFDQLDHDLVERTLKLAFIDEGANPIIVGPQGVGKTTLARNIAHNAVTAGRSVAVTTAGRMLTELTATDSPSKLKRKVSNYCGVALLVIDELGYMSYDDRAADLLFEIVTRRHEAGRPIVITTNLPFAKWNSIFPNATCTVALIDRLTHRSDIIAIKAKSWRHKESKERADRIKKAK